MTDASAPDTGVTRLVARGAGAAIAVRLGGMGLRFVQTLVLAKLLGSRGFGEFTIVSNIALMLAIPAGLGLPLGVVRFVSEYRSTEPPLLRGLVDGTRRYVLIAGCTIAIAADLVFLAFGADFVPVPVFVAGTALVPLLAMLTLDQAFMRASHRIVLSQAPATLLLPVLAIAAAVVATVAGSADPLAPLLGIGAGALVGLVALRTPVRALLAGPEVPPVRETRRWLRVSLPLMLVSTFTVFMNYADVVLIGFILGPVEAGVYGVASRTAGVATIATTGINTSAMPVISDLRVRGDLDELQAAIRTMCRWSMLASLGVGGVLVAGREPLLGAIGDDFRAGATAFVIIVGANLVSSFFGPVELLCAVADLERAVAAAQGSAAVANITLNLLLIPRYGIEGAAWATLASTASWNVALAVVSTRRLDVRPTAI